ncbi:ATP-binding protein, partial [Mycobacterium sp.]|uniref:ATP-binding protein n=1 Tax=Mycobacterium sp. TaxID=1785 RepID=UPI003C74A416
MNRPVEFRAVDDFLNSAAAEPSALVVEGEPGIGKTTLWLAATDLARERGFHVFAARPAASESMLAYASLADMLNSVDAAVVASLPPPQCLALDRVMLQANGNGATDERTVAAGFLSLLNALAGELPLLLAIDDLQWLDSSSKLILGFAARRFSGCVSMLCTLRTDPEDRPASWLQLPRPEALRRIRLAPLGLGGLREVVSARLGRSFPRPAMVRIHEISRGNPSYAIELARVLDDGGTTSELHLPGTLAELVRKRVAALGVEARDALLAASCAAAPTVELVARVTGTDAERVVRLLADAEDQRIVGIDGHRINFTHPLLARGVYDDASSARRREMHRRLAEIVEEPELQARHRAMAVAWGDPHTLQCLDKAAEAARMRGAPASAAELLDMAISLGGDTDERRIQLAANYFAAGDPARARSLLEKTIEALAPGALQAEALSLLGAVHAFDDSYLEAVSLWERSLDEADSPALRVPTLIILSLALFNVGRLVSGIYTAESAVRAATRLGQPLLMSQALIMRVLLGFLHGDGVDEPSLHRALELEKRGTGFSVAPGLQMVLRPSLQNALLLGWTGQLDKAHDELRSLRRVCVECGQEYELMYIAYYSVQIEVWSGNFSEANIIADDAMERAVQLGGDIGLGEGLTMRAACAAYAGAEQQTRRDAIKAITIHQRCGAHAMAAWPTAVLGFLEVSLGNYEAALTTLEPLLTNFDAASDGTEISVAGFLPDAVEALVHLGRLDDAGPLIEALERNGRRLDRAWMLAVGARCQAMVFAARGQLEAAN